MKEALKKTNDGVTIEFEVSPNAKKTEIHGYNLWRKRIEIRISEQAQKGAANEELISYLSEIFRINQRNIQIISGMTNTKKTVKIIGVDIEDVLKVLNEKKNP